MEFKIIHKENPNLLGYDGFLLWPEKTINVNSRPFRKTFDYSKYNSEQIYWELNKYLGPVPNRQIDFVPSGVKHDFVIPEISVKKVAKVLNETELIGGEYKACEGDEIKLWKDYLYKGINGIKRQGIHHNIISLIYNNGIWSEGNYNFDFDETQFLLNGIVKY